MAKLLVQFTGVMCHYDPTIDPDRDPRVALPYSRRTIFIDASRTHHPHEAYLEIYKDTAVSDAGWPVCKRYSRAGKCYQRYSLDGVRLTIPSRDTTLTVDPSFQQFVPALGQVIYGFGPIKSGFLEFDPQTPDLIAAHFDMIGGRLAALSYDQYSSQFVPPWSWPPSSPTTSIPLASSVGLELDVENEGAIKVVGHFYKTGKTAVLLLNPNTTRITIGNLVPDEIRGLPYADRQRTHHFTFYYDLSKNPLTMQPVPKTKEIGLAKGTGGGCPGTQYPP